MTKRNKIFIVIAIIILIVSIIGIVYATIERLIKLDNERYKTVINTPPENERLETELKDILVTDTLNIVDYTQEETSIIFTVEIPILNTNTVQLYNVLYKLKYIQSEFGKYYKWTYVSHRYICNISG